MSQLDFICTNCPLETCNEESLWCAMRWIKKPNAKQVQLRQRYISEMTAKRRKRKHEKRKEYFRNYYAENREKKLAAANERNRNARVSNAEVVGRESTLEI